MCNELSHEMIEVKVTVTLYKVAKQKEANLASLLLYTLVNEPANY